jgi:hypothetical protein
VLAMMPNDARKRDRRLRVSVKERAEGVDAFIGESRTTIAVAVAVSLLDGGAGGN